MSVSEHQRKLREVLGIGRIEPPSEEGSTDPVQSQASLPPAQQGSTDKTQEDDVPQAGFGAHADAQVEPVSVEEPTPGEDQ